MDWKEISEKMKEFKESNRITGIGDVEFYCYELGLSEGEVAHILSEMYQSKVYELARYHYEYNILKRECDIEEEALDRAYDNKNQKQRSLVKASLPIAKKELTLPELDMELGLGFSDKIIMMKHGISRTTLWRRKKELEEWKRKNRNMF